MSKADETRSQLIELVERLVGEQGLNRVLRAAQREYDIEDDGRHDATLRAVPLSVQAAAKDDDPIFMLVRHDAESGGDGEAYYGQTITKVIERMAEPAGHYHVFIVIAGGIGYSYIQGGELEVRDDGWFTYNQNRKRPIEVECLDLAKRLVSDESSIPARKHGRPIAGRNWKPIDGLYPSRPAERKVPVVRIRKHIAKPITNYRRSGGPRLYTEGQTFDGASFEEIIEEHPRIRGLYHVEVIIDRYGSRSSYLLGGDLVIHDDGTHTYTEHDRADGVVEVSCQIQQQTLTLMEGSLRNEDPNRPVYGKNWLPTAIRSGSEMAAD